MKKAQVESIADWIVKFIQPQNNQWFNISGQLNEEGEFVKVMNPKRTKPTKKDIKNHVRGKIQIGTPPIYKDREVGGINEWSVVFSALDIDAANESKKELNRAKDDTLKMYYYAKSLGLKCYIESSKSRGYHLWFFYDEPIPAIDAKMVMEHIKNHTQSEAEIFPKQSERRMGVYEKGTYGNALTMPLCGAFIPKGKTVFMTTERETEGSNQKDYYDPKDLFLIPHKDQIAFLETMEKNSRQDVISVLRLCPKKISIKNQVGFTKKNQALKYEAGSSEEAKEKCWMIQQFEKPDTADKVDFQSWNTVCMSLSLFSNYKKMIPKIFVDSPKYPKGVNDALKKVTEYVNQGCRGGRCEYTKCPYVGDLTKCSVQSITSCFLTGKSAIPTCPYSYDDIKDDEEIFTMLNAYLEKFPSLRRMWERGEYIEYDKETKERKTKHMKDPKEITSVKTLESYTKKLADHMLYLGIEEELVFYVIPLFKYGLAEGGNPDSYWRIVYKASEKNEKTQGNRDKDFLRTVKKKKNISVQNSGERTGIYEEKFSNGRISREQHRRNLEQGGRLPYAVLEDDGESEKIEVRFTERYRMASFVLTLVGVIIDHENNSEPRYLVKYKPSTKGKQRTEEFEVVISTKATMNSDVLYMELLKSVPRKVIAMDTTSKSTSQTIWEEAQERTPFYKEIVNISSAGKNTEVGAIFMKNSYCYKGKFFPIDEKKKTIKVGQHHCYLQYLDAEEETLSRIPSPIYQNVHNIERYAEIRDMLIENAIIAWGGPEKGLEILTLIGWMAASIYKDEIRELCSGFPLVHMSANMSVGKNKQTSMLTKIIGLEDPVIVNVQKTSIASLRRTFTQNVITLLDEMKPNERSYNIEEMLKALYDGTTFTMANLSDQDRVKAYKMKCSAWITTQSEPKTEAFKDRCILLRMDDKWRKSNKENKRINDLAVARLDGRKSDYGGMTLSELYAFWIANYNEDTIGNFINSFISFKNLFSELEITDRQCEIYAAVWAGMTAVVYQDTQPEAYPEHYFGLKHFTKTKEPTKFLATLYEMASEKSDKKHRQPEYNFLEIIADQHVSVSNLNDTDIKNFSVYVAEHEGEEKIFFVFRNLFTIYRKFQKEVGDQDNIGTKIKYNLKQWDGYEGMIAPASKGNFKIKMMCYSKDSEVWEYLAHIAGRINEDGQVVGPYMEE